MEKGVLTSRTERNIFSPGSPLTPFILQPSPAYLHTRFLLDLLRTVESFNLWRMYSKHQELVPKLSYSPKLSSRGAQWAHSPSTSGRRQRAGYLLIDGKDDTSAQDQASEPHGAPTPEALDTTCPKDVPDGLTCGCAFGALCSGFDGVQRLSGVYRDDPSYCSDTEGGDRGVRKVEPPSTLS